MAGDVGGSGLELATQLANLLQQNGNRQPSNPKLSDNLQISIKLNSQNYALWTRMTRVAIGAQAKGGLGVSSLYALNRGLMLKWVWRFYSQKTALRVRVVKAIHGEDGKVGKTIKSGNRSCWLNIVKEMEVNLVPMSDRYAWSLESSGEFLVASIRKKINNNYLPNVSSMTRWVKYVPIKVNILA
nr:RNA-directed DNA polymerase, eukaryota, reverse transcriptase zinc-binding domain protein [Tanacetum cinerariifolium]